jgi:hypothetical protein
VANLLARLRKLEVAIPARVEINAAEMYLVANVAHAQMSYEDLSQLQAVSLFMLERPGETLLDCHGILTPDQRRAISRYARAAADAQLIHL